MSTRHKRALTGGSAFALIFGLLVAIPASPATAAPADPVDIQILGINDFHGRIQADGQSAGAAVLAGAVNSLRAANPNTVFAAAGDLIGASTFASFIDNDNPTIDALNEAGLDVSAVGNHEFDQGYKDLVDRVIPRAHWKYLGANVRNADGTAALDEAWIDDVDGVKVGFVGAVTEHLSELVSPAGIAGLTIEAPVVAANRTADLLKKEGADMVVLLVHEGAATTDISSSIDPNSDFGKIVTGVNDNVDAIISGHTHLSYNHSIPVPGWEKAGRTVTERPVVSAGQYGYNLNQLKFVFDKASKSITKVEQKILPLTELNADGKWVPAAGYAPDATTQTIVDKAVANAAVLGAKPLGKIAGPFNRAKLADGTENRGGESTLGNLVAEAQRWATQSETTGSAEIAFMNPGGLRKDMLGNGPTYPTDLTYKQAAEVQPFANTLVNMTMTGEQIRAVLEQQWQPDGSSRPFLRLGMSEGFTYTYDPSAASGSHITDMWLNGEAVDSAASYSVTVNSFLASGGDNFGVFAEGANPQDTGQTDLQGMVDYMAAMTKDAPLEVDYSQRGVGVTFPAGAPKTYTVGDKVTFDLSSLLFTAPGDVTDSEVTVTLEDGTKVGTFPVDNAVRDADATVVSDESGTATVTFTVPAGVKAGAHALTISGAATGTTSSVALVTVDAATSAVPVTPAAPGTPTKPTLPDTGMNALPFGGAAALLFMFGAGAMIVARRRRTTRTGGVS